MNFSKHTQISATLERANQAKQANQEAQVNTKKMKWITLHRLSHWSSGYSAVLQHLGWFESPSYTITHSVQVKLGASQTLYIWRGDSNIVVVVSWDAYK